MGLIMKTGTTVGISLTDNVTIETGLSVIKEFVIYVTEITTTGLVLCHYNSELGENSRSTYCNSSYEGENMGGISYTTKPVVEGGHITISGSTPEYANTNNLAPGITYTWIAYGEE